MVMCFLAGWMTLLTVVLVSRWGSMNESEQMLWIITPEQIMLNVFATIVFWGLVVVTRQNTSVAGWAGIVLYCLFALGTVWAVGNKAEQINALKHATPGNPDYMSPLDMLTDPMAAVIHLIRIGLLYSNPSSAYLSEFLVGSLEQARLSHVQLVVEKCDDKQHEEEVVRHVVAGLRNAEVARELSITEETVKTHLNRVFRKLGVRDRVELVLHMRRAQG